MMLFTVEGGGDQDVPKFGLGLDQEHYPLIYCVLLEQGILQDLEQSTWKFRIRLLANEET